MGQTSRRTCRGTSTKKYLWYIFKRKGGWTISYKTRYHFLKYPCVYVLKCSHVCVGGFPGGTSGKEPTCQCRRHWDASSLPGSGRSPGGRQGNPLHYSCLDNPKDRGAWQATVHGVAKSWTRLKWLNMHSRMYYLREKWYTQDSQQRCTTVENVMARNKDGRKSGRGHLLHFTMHFSTVWIFKIQHKCLIIVINDKNAHSNFKWSYFFSIIIFNFWNLN